MISLGELFFIMVVAAGLVYWWKAQELKELASRATRQHCQRYDVQFLDESMVLSKISFARNEQGLPALRRMYLFEFTSTGTDRTGGTTCLLGKRVESVQLDPYRIN